MITASSGPRVLHIVGDSSAGGVTKVVEAISDHLARRGWLASVVTTDARFTERLRARGVEVVPILVPGRSRNPLRDLVALVQLAREMRRGNYDVVHTHRPKVSLLARLAAALVHRGAVVHTVHGFVFGDESPAWFTRLAILLERCASRHTDVVVAVTETHGSDLIRLGMAPSSKVVAIPNGLDDEPPLSRERWRGTGPLEIACVGRLVPGKGLEDIIRAAALVEPGRREWRLTMFGDGPLKGVLRELSQELGVANRLTVAGYVSNVPERLASMHVFILASKREGLSIALLEAMRAGLAIVASDIPGNREATGHGQCAMLFPPGSVGELAAGVSLLLTKDWESLRQMGDTARHHFIMHYQAEDMNRRYLALYEEVRSAPTTP